MSEPEFGGGGAGTAGMFSGRYREVAGLVLLVTGGQFLLVMMLGATIAPGYSLNGNAISDLGVGQTAALFNVSIVITGLGNAAAGLEYYRVHGRRWLFSLFLLTGVGAVGVGLFPETTGAPHLIFALVAFIALNLQVVACATRVGRPMRWLGVLAGLVGLAFLALFVAGVGNPRLFGPIGYGGVERMIVYPAILWLSGFAGVLVGRDGVDGEVV